MIKRFWYWLFPKREEQAEDIMVYAKPEIAQTIPDTRVKLLVSWEVADNPNYVEGEVINRHPSVFRSKGPLIVYVQSDNRLKIWGLLEGKYVDINGIELPKPNSINGILYQYHVTDMQAYKMGIPC